MQCSTCRTKENLSQVGFWLANKVPGSQWLSKETEEGGRGDSAMTRAKETNHTKEVKKGESVGMLVQGERSHRRSAQNGSGQ